MRRKCQVYQADGKQCEEPAVDFVEVIHGEGDVVRIRMCAFHWDAYQKKERHSDAKR